MSKNIIVIAAHPDEADMYAGGVCALYAKMGHRVKFLSLTNGDIGSYEMEAEPLAQRRNREAQDAKECLGIHEYEVIQHISDGALMQDIPTRRLVVDRIRRWEADYIITFHPDGEGHIDNRGAGKCVREAAGFLTNVPMYLPKVPQLKRQPVILLMPDFTTKQTYRPDIAVDVSDTIEQKLRACHAHVSQFSEFAPYQGGFLDKVPKDKGYDRDFLLKYWDYCLYKTDEMRDTLRKWYGAEKEKAIEFAEAYEIATFGRQPDKEDMEILMCQ